MVSSDLCVRPGQNPRALMFLSNAAKSAAKPAVPELTWIVRRVCWHGSSAEMAEVMGASVVYQARQVFGKQWSLSGGTVEMSANGIRPLRAPSYHPAAAGAGELSGGRGLPPHHAAEAHVRRSPAGGQVLPLVAAHPISGRSHVFVHTLCMECVLLADGRRLSWAQSQAFVERVLAPLCQPARVARVRWEAGALAIFDNRSLLHAGTPPGPSPSATRLMHRVSKVGALVPTSVATARL
jgi:hypothetical protein